MMTTPKPFYKNLNKLKAFVLGCDPTAYDLDNNPLSFEYVFDLGNDKRYFSGILKNLELLRISSDEIYVQNLITDYQMKETGKNKDWNRVAISYIPKRKEEFDIIDQSGTIPVFLTSEVLYRVLLVSEQKIFSAKQLYESEDLIPIPSDSNLLGRPLIPLFRHRNYSLSKKEDYRKRIINCLSI